MITATIVVPAYNAAATLPETLRSLQAQAYANFEILVVDDGSRDTTPEIARKFAETDQRIRTVSQANRGLAGARNTGIAAARGRYVGFCDADDLWEPGKLAAHVRHLDSNPAVGLSYSGALLIDEAGAPLGLAQQPRLTGITPAQVFLRNPVGNGSAAVMRREATAAIAWRPRSETRRDWVFDETFTQSEDIECWLRLALTTDWAIEGIPGALVRYRVNGAGLSAATDRQRAAWERMVAKLTPLAPEFFRIHTPAARAYQLRYLARRAVSSGDARRAFALVCEALRWSRAPLRAEPAKTVTTLAAASLMRLAGETPIRLARAVLRRRKLPLA